MHACRASNRRETLSADRRRPARPRQDCGARGARASHPRWIARRFMESSFADCTLCNGRGASSAVVVHRSWPLVGARGAIPIHELAAAVTHARGEHDQGERADRGNDARRTSHDSGCEPDRDHEDERAREHEKLLPALFVRLECLLGNDAFNPVFLRLARLHGNPRAHGERGGDDERNGPRAARCGPASDRPECDERDDRKQKRENDWEMHDGRMERIWKHEDLSVRG